jgi:hypothetical protein
MSPHPGPLQRRGRKKLVLFKVLSFGEDLGEARKLNTILNLLK